MKAEVIQINLNTEKGTFKFENHFNSESDFYNAMCLFESNNWELLGDYTYTAITQFSDGDLTETEFNGINASANLAEYIELIEA